MMRRRQTLGALDAQMNARDQPPSQMSKMMGPAVAGKPGRPSRLPHPGRQSMAPAGAANANALALDLKRMSLSAAAAAGQYGGNNENQAPPASMGGGRPSLSAAPRASLSARRSSVYGRPSMAGGSHGGHHHLMKDPRPIRNKGWQVAAIKILVEFLLESGYDKPISQKILNAPSAKDFQCIFKFLYQRLDPGYEWRKKFEEEVQGLMKGLRYPFADSISKTQLHAVGSIHTWPSCLAMLVWMVELVLAEERLAAEAEEDDSLANQPDQIFLTFLCRAYQDFLIGDDDQDAMDADLADCFRRKDEWTMQEVAKLKAANEALELELKELTSEEPPLVRMNQEKTALETDIAKVHKWTETLLLKQEQLSEQIAKIREVNQQVEIDMAEASKERTELQEIVDAQQISPADVDRMNAERDQLSRSIEQMTEKNEEVSKTIWEREITCQKKMDQVETLAQDFNNKAYRLDLIPASASNADGLNFELTINGHAARAENMTSVDLRGPVKNCLMDLRSKLKSKIIHQEDQIIAIKETFDRAIEAVTEKMDEIHSLEMKLRKAQETHDTEKETGQAELQSKMDEIEKLERELRRVKVDSTRGLFDAQRAARELQMEYETLIRRTGEQKERLVKETLKALDYLVEFKSHISNGLNELVKTALDDYTAEANLIPGEIFVDGISHGQEIMVDTRNSTVSGGQSIEATNSEILAKMDE